MLHILRICKKEFGKHAFGEFTERSVDKAKWSLGAKADVKVGEYSQDKTGRGNTKRKRKKKEREQKGKGSGL